MVYPCESILDNKNSSEADSMRLCRMAQHTVASPGLAVLFWLPFELVRKLQRAPMETPAKENRQAIAHVVGERAP